jgi:hypothetical protein
VSDEPDHFSVVWSSIFYEAWTDDMLLVAFYLLAGRHRRTEGLYRWTIGYGAPDMSNSGRKWSDRRFRKAFDALVEEGFVEYDESAHVLLVVNALKRHGLNGNQITGVVNAVARLPETPLLKRFLLLAQEFNKPLFERLRERFPQALT